MFYVRNQVQVIYFNLQNVHVIIILGFEIVPFQKWGEKTENCSCPTNVSP